MADLAISIKIPDSHILRSSISTSTTPHMTNGLSSQLITTALFAVAKDNAIDFPSWGPGYLNPHLHLCRDPVQLENKGERSLCAHMQ